MRARLHALGGVLAFAGTLAHADGPPQRPSIGMYRWQEDWSFLADPADASRTELRLAFVDGNFDAGGASVKWRIGRQEMAFDLQRFFSVRGAPNVRQAYDAVWGDYERSDWRVSCFISQPVQYLNDSALDDFSNRHLMYGGVRVQRQNVAGGEINATFSEYRNDSASFPAGAGKEHRRNLDLRWAAAARGVGTLWRQTTRDTAFAQPSVAQPNTAGASGWRTADYAELRIDWAALRSIALALEADRCEVARVVRDAGGHDSTYIGAEIRWGW